MKTRRTVSLITFLILSGCLIYGRFLMPRWLTYDHLSILSWDVFGYYLYLPAQFIHNDIGITDFSWLQQILDKYAPTIGFYQAYFGPSGEYVMKYPMGMAILYAPFFFLALVLSAPLGFPVDGFSLPFQVSIALGCLLYGIIGLWFLRKILLRFFSDRISAITMALLVLGTNYFQLTAYDSAMVHNPLFVIYTLILYFTIRYHDDPKWKYAIPLALFIGLAALVRPTEIISILIPLFWGVYNKESIREKLRLVTNHLPQITGMILLIFLTGLLQMIYWKLHAGTWIYYSYEKNERLKFLAPYIISVFFSWKKGWLIYAPMMIFPLAGLIFLFRQFKQIFWSVFLFFTVNLLLVASWTTWWYGGSLGQRSLMQSYVILAFPFGAFISWLEHRKWLWKGLFAAITLFLIWLNLFQTWQYMTWIIDPSRMTKAYYWKVFGEKNVPEGAHRYLEPLENFDREFLNDTVYDKRILAFYNFEQDGTNLDTHVTTDQVRSGNYSFRMDSTQEFSPGIKRPYREISPSENAWIRVKVYIYPVSNMKDSPASLVITINGDNGNYKYKSIELAEANLQAGKWNEVVMDYELPYIPDENDLVTVYIWNRGNRTFYVDDLLIELLNLQ